MRVDGFPLDEMRAVRMTYLLQKKLRECTNAVLRQYDLGDTSHTVLAILYGSPDETSTTSQLGHASGEKPANLTRVCDDLVSRGLIKRSAQPGDRRAVLVSLSDQGRALTEAILPRVSDALAPTFASFSAEELQQLLDLSAKALRCLDGPD